MLTGMGIKKERLEILKELRIPTDKPISVASFREIINACDIFNAQEGNPNKETFEFIAWLHKNIVNNQHKSGFKQGVDQSLSAIVRCIHDTCSKRRVRSEETLEEFDIFLEYIKTAAANTSLTDVEFAAQCNTECKTFHTKAQNIATEARARARAARAARAAKADPQVNLEPTTSVDAAARTEPQYSLSFLDAAPLQPEQLHLRYVTPQKSKHEDATTDSTAEQVAPPAKRPCLEGCRI